MLICLTEYRSISSCIYSSPIKCRHVFFSTSTLNTILPTDSAVVRRKEFEGEKNSNLAENQHIGQEFKERKKIQ